MRLRQCGLTHKMIAMKLGISMHVVTIDLYRLTHGQFHEVSRDGELRPFVNPHAQA